ncbi:MAG: 6-phosphogluconolactonase [Betaproteobacteria bacterium]|nr:6-phosphogluconolactonase [Betaproteobacteria bacterium]
MALTQPQDAAKKTWVPATRGNVTVHKVSTDRLAIELAQDIAQRLHAAIQTRGKAVLGVSGGKSPIALFEALRVHDIDWSKVIITLVDERCVTNTHPDSNAHLVKQHLMQDAAHAASLVPMVNDTIDMSDATQQADWASMELQTVGPADVLVLGMGADGHTASLFPEAPNLAQALDLHNTQGCVGITLAHPPANAPYPRVTQTLAHLLTAKHIVLPISSDDKRNTLQRAWSHAQDTLPVSHVLHQTQAPVAVWIAT